jgi:hypothetical protein
LFGGTLRRNGLIVGRGGSAFGGGAGRGFGEISRFGLFGPGLIVGRGRSPGFGLKRSGLFGSLIFPGAVGRGWVGAVTARYGFVGIFRKIWASRNNAQISSIEFSRH